MKLLAILMFIPALAAAQTRYIHYSELGKYIVDERGHRTTISGHPLISCEEKTGTYSGVFFKEVGGVIYMRALNTAGSYVYHIVRWPVCELR